MLTGLLILHVVVCVLLTITVLLQFGKGAEVGAVMGGGQSQNVFSSNSRGNFFTKLTTFLAIVFMINSIALSVLKSKDSKTSVFDNEAPKARALNTDQKDVAKGSAIPTDAKKEETKATDTKTDKK